MVRERGGSNRWQNWVVLRSLLPLGRTSYLVMCQFPCCTSQ